MKTGAPGERFLCLAEDDGTFGMQNVKTDAQGAEIRISGGFDSGRTAFVCF